MTFINNVKLENMQRDIVKRQQESKRIEKFELSLKNRNFEEKEMPEVKKKEENISHVNHVVLVALDMVKNLLKNGMKFQK